VGFVEDLDSVGSRLQQTQDAYDSAYKKLSTGRGNLINRAEGIKKLGAKTSKNLSNNLLNDAEDESETI
jgi:DNA recombination protein RmuC